MPLHPGMVDWMVNTANEYVSEAVDLILRDHGAQNEETQRALVAALVKVGMCVGRPEVLERYTAPNSLAIATASVEAAVALYCRSMADAITITEQDLAAWAGFNSANGDNDDGIGFYEACDFASLPAEMLMECTYFLTALRHYRDVWLDRDGVVGMPDAIEDNQARWQKMVQDVEAAVKRYEDSLVSNPNTRPALRFVAENMPLLNNLAFMWPDSQPLPWWLNSDQLRSELSEHPAQ